MLMPRKVAHRKHHRGRTAGVAKGGTEVSFGEYGIQALEPGWLTARQIEAARIAMTRAIKRGGKVWIYKGDVVQSRAEREAAEAALRAAQRARPARPARTERPTRTANSRRDGGTGEPVAVAEPVEANAVETNPEALPVETTEES